MGAYGGRRDIMQMVAPAGMTTHDVHTEAVEYQQFLPGLPKGSGLHMLQEYL